MVDVHKSGGPVTVNPDFHWSYDGMTLRDWFAGKAVSSLISEKDLRLDEIAALSYEMADALIAERNK